jgi:hypothetical protein
MLDTALDMSATRTQVYLTVDQRRRLDARARQEGRTLAHLIREAVDVYLAGEPDIDSLLDATFGPMPDLEVPTREDRARRSSERVGGVDAG